MTIEAQAAVLREQSAPMLVETIRLPDIGPRSVHVRMHAMAVCHSDYSLANGTLRQALPAVLGHEGSGTVVATGADVNGFEPGDRVILNWAPACGTCFHCLNDEQQLCIHAADGARVPYAHLDDGTEVYAGLSTAAFASDAVLDERALLKIPPDIPLDLGALVGCAVFTGVGAVLNSARVAPGDSVAVVGLGGVGLCAVQGARIAGAHPIIAIDINPAKADLALELGAARVRRRIRRHHERGAAAHGWPGGGSRHRVRRPGLDEPAILVAHPAGRPGHDPRSRTSRRAGQLQPDRAVPLRAHDYRRPHTSVTPTTQPAIKQADRAKPGAYEIEAGKPIAEIAVQLGVSDQTIYNWRNQDQIDRGQRAGMSTAESTELTAARKRIRDLETELAVMKRANELLKAQSDPKGAGRSSRKS